MLSGQGEAAGPNGSVCLRKTDGSPVVRLGEGNAGGLSPDGKWVLSQRLRPGAPIVLLPTGPGEPKEASGHGLTANLYLSSAWFPDGKRVLLSAREANRGLGRLYVLSIDGGSPRPISPEGVGGGITGGIGGIALSPEGTLVAAVGLNRKIELYPVEGGASRPVPGAVEGDVPVQWSSDGRSLYVTQRWEYFSPVHVLRLDLETGKREFWRDLIPEDSAGAVLMGNVRVTPDGRSYAYIYLRELSDLYVAEGLK